MTTNLTKLTKIILFNQIDKNNIVPKIVEIDESCFTKSRRSYHPSVTPSFWLFGGIERGTQKSFLVEVPDKTAATLEAIITEWVQPGTRIISDGWASYANLDNLHGGIYKHDVVIHERHFVDPDNESVHTQKIGGK